MNNKHAERKYVCTHIYTGNIRSSIMKKVPTFSEDLSQTRDESFSLKSYLFPDAYRISPFSSNHCHFLYCSLRICLVVPRHNIHMYYVFIWNCTALIYIQQKIIQQIVNKFISILIVHVPCAIYQYSFVFNLISLEAGEGSLCLCISRIILNKQVFL